MMKLKDKNNKTMEEVSKGYEEFIKEKEVKSNGKSLFNKAIKKASKPKKQRGSK